MPLDLRHVLIVSPDEKLLESLRAPFAASHYALHSLAHADAPSIDVFVQNVDALIVDLEPDCGPETRRRLSHLFRAARVPALAITAHNRAQQLIVALEAGAQAVLSRPIHIPELVARLDVLVPAAGPTRALAAQFLAPYVILDTAASTLASPGCVMALSIRETALLSLLGQSINHAVSRELLCQCLGVPCDRQGLDVVRQTMTRLRRKLDGDTSAAVRLVAERHHGYGLWLAESHTAILDRCLAGPPG